MCVSVPFNVFWTYKGWTQFCIFMQSTLFSLSAETDSVIKIFVMVLTTVMNPATPLAFQVTWVVLSFLCPAETLTMKDWESWHVHAHWQLLLYFGPLFFEEGSWCYNPLGVVDVPPSSGSQSRRGAGSVRGTVSRTAPLHLDAAETQLPCGYQKLNWAEQHLFHGAEQPWRQWINSSQGMFSTHPHLSLLLFSFSHLLFSSYSLDKPNLTSFYNTQLLPGSGLVWLRRQSHCVSVPLNYFGSWRGTGRVLKEKFWKRERVFFPFASWKILLAPRSCF